MAKKYSALQNQRTAKKKPPPTKYTITELIKRSWEGTLFRKGYNEKWPFEPGVYPGRCPGWESPEEYSYRWRAWRWLQAEARLHQRTEDDKLRIGIWPEFTKEEQKIIRKELKGLDATGLATPRELMDWANKAIADHLEDAKERQRGLFE